MPKNTTMLDHVTKDEQRWMWTLYSGDFQEQPHGPRPFLLRRNPVTVCPIPEDAQAVLHKLVARGWAGVSGMNGHYPMYRLTRQGLELMDEALDVRTFYIPRKRGRQ